jgi:hypothetical protein
MHCFRRITQNVGFSIFRLSDFSHTLKREAFLCALRAFVGSFFLLYSALPEFLSHKGSENTKVFFCGKNKRRSLLCGLSAFVGQALCSPLIRSVEMSERIQNGGL